jgi:hypothetical protein
VVAKPGQIAHGDGDHVGRLVAVQMALVVLKAVLRIEAQARGLDVLGQNALRFQGGDGGGHLGAVLAQGLGGGGGVGLDAEVDGGDVRRRVRFAPRG